MFSAGGHTVSAGNIYVLAFLTITLGALRTASDWIQVTIQGYSQSIGAHRELLVKLVAKRF
jgi:hypothetical protein